MSIDPLLTNEDRKHILLKHWDYLCVICGRPFASLACVTVEHLIPRDLGGKGSLRFCKQDNLHSNLGPSHHRCNNRRGTRSLVRAAASIEREFQHIVCHSGEASALKWLNKAVPSSPHSLEPIVPSTQVA